MIGRRGMMGAAGLVIAAPPSGGIQDFTTFTKEDPFGNLSIDSATQITVSDLSRDSVAYIGKDFGVSYFSGDYSVRGKVNVSSIAYGNMLYFSLIGNYLDVGQGYLNAAHAFVGFRAYNNQFNLVVYNPNATGTQFNKLILNNVSINTDYYWTITRVDTGGANSQGLYTITIRSGSHTGSVISSDTFDVPQGEYSAFSNFSSLLAPTSNGSGGTYQISCLLADLEIL